MAAEVSTSSSDQHDHSLKGGVLGLFDSTIMGIAGSAPAYSISATTFFLFGAVGYGGPAALLYCGFFMFGIVFAFNYLSRAESHAGASYAWVRRALHPVLGYIAGWCVIVSAIIFMVIATFPAGSSLLSLFSDSWASNTTAVTVFGAFFFLLMIAAVAAGVTVTVTVQIIMSCIEIFLLLLFAGLALFHAHHVTGFSWHWFAPSIFHSTSGNTFWAGALLAAFYFWGWDVTANLNEETKNAKKIAGYGGLLGALVVFLLFEVFTIATNMVLTKGELTDQNNSADIINKLGQAVWHGQGGKLIVVGILLSTVATLETTIIQVTRTLYTMGRDHTLPKGLGRTHPVRKSPITAVVTVAFLSLALFVASSYIGSIYNILSDGYNAIGLQICVYYALAGLAVVILYRRQIFKSVGNFLFMGLWPLLGAIFMTVLFTKVLPGLNTTTKWVGLGSIALGIVPMAWYGLGLGKILRKLNLQYGSQYFLPVTKEDRHAAIETLEENL